MLLWAEAQLAAHGVTDHVLDASAANIAASITNRLTGVTVAEAHMGAAVGALHARPAALAGRDGYA